MLDRDHRPRFVLASASPRRAALLGRLGIEIEVRPVDLDETPLRDEPPAAYVQRLARAKADAAWEPGTLVVAADTTVAVDGRLLGKPVDADDARRMLRMLSGRPHDVFTGVAIRADSTSVGPITRAASEHTEVWFVELTARRVEWYLRTEEPFDKAGAYAIQGRGSLFVERVRGNVDNVIGLPMTVVDRLLWDAGFDLLSFATPLPT